MLLDVREPSELAARGAAPGALNIPLPQLRQRMAELPADKKVYVYCQVGMRGAGWPVSVVLLAGVCHTDAHWKLYCQVGGWSCVLWCCGSWCCMVFFFWPGTH